ncbi:hypothetical protein BDW69DRAFT_155734 [Aspergillus filifer]
MMNVSELARPAVRKRERIQRSLIFGDPRLIILGTFMGSTWLYAYQILSVPWSWILEKPGRQFYVVSDARLAWGILVHPTRKLERARPRKSSRAQFVAA